MTHFTWLLVALPLAGAAILLFGGRRTDAWGHWLGCAAAVAPFCVGATLLVEMLGRDGADRVIHQK
ncbi:MAG TPA: NADH-quinone oxidoreductase subunit L, partial [Mycobacterium sp.]|nr:NADH-quinone oxidoreductase subunit L [Mycobacterium sp.]